MNRPKWYTEQVNPVGKVSNPLLFSSCLPISPTPPPGPCHHLRRTQGQPGGTLPGVLQAPRVFRHPRVPRRPLPGGRPAPDGPRSARESTALCARGRRAPSSPQRSLSPSWSSVPHIYCHARPTDGSSRTALRLPMARDIEGSGRRLRRSMKIHRRLECQTMG